MKKYLIGGIVGFILAFGASAHAEGIETIVGKAIQGVFAVQVDGEKLEKEAIVIDGTTYLPVRAFGEAIGYEVTFDAELGVSMKKKVNEKLVKERELRSVEYEITKNNESKEYYTDRLHGLTDSLSSYPEDNPEYKKGRDEALTEIEKAKAELAKLEAELPELEKQKADLEVELAELQKQP